MAMATPRVLVIVGGHVVTDEEEFDGDVVVIGEMVAMVTNDAIVCAFYEQLPGATLLDARGKLVMPGGIDPHCHLEYPQGAAHVVSCDDWHTGSVAAVCGGTTTLIDFVEAVAGQSFPDALVHRRAAAEARSMADFSLHMAINRADASALGDELNAVVSNGVSSFKIYTAYDGIRLRDDEMLRAFAAIKRVGGLPIVHAENHDLIMSRVAQYRNAGVRSPAAHPSTRPVQGESEATHRVVMLAEAVGIPAGVHIVHVTAEIALPSFQIGKNSSTRVKGMGPVTGEVCAHHLSLTDAVYSQPDGADHVCAPPLRPQSDVEQRRGDRRTPEFRKHWVAPSSATELLAPAMQQVETMQEDVAAERWIAEAGPGKADPPFFSMPGGVAGIEARMLLTYQHGVIERGMTLKEFVRATSTAAARRYNLWPRKGSLCVGADADVILLDPSRDTSLNAAELHQNCDHSPFEGKRAHVAVDTVIARGTILVAHGQLVASQLGHRGHFLPRPPYPAPFY